MKTLQEQLIEKGLSRLHTSETKQKSIKAKGKPKERLSDRDWAELMGSNRPTYARKKGGALKQR